MSPALVTRQVSNLLVVHFIGRLSLETKPRPKSCQLYRSSDVGFRDILSICQLHILLSRTAQSAAITYR